MMDSLQRALNRFRSFFRKDQMDQELAAEVATHLELAIEENIHSGMSATEARRQALIRFGGVEQAKEHQREARGIPALDILLQDLRYTFRTLRRDRVFTCIAVLILGLGIGANVAVFSVVNTILLRPLPFPQPQQLAWIATGKAGAIGLSSTTSTVSAFEEFRRHNRSFQDVAAYMAFYGDSDYKLIGHGEPQPVSGVEVSGNFFQTLEVQPIYGRLFTDAESQKGSRPEVVLSNAFWHRQFGSDPSIVGKAITLNKDLVTVMGVLPPNFDFGSVFAPGTKIDIFVPAVMDNLRDDGHVFAIVGRLKPGVSLAQAQAESNLLFPQLKAMNPSWFDTPTGTITGLKEYVSGKLRRSLMVLWGAVGMILLIVCVNLSNLLIARAATRRKEFALRSALGAGRTRIVRQLLTESFVLSGLGALLGLGFAYGTTTWLSHQGSIALPLLSSITVDRVALAWTVIIAIVTGAIFGLIPALKMSSKNLQDDLKDSSRSMISGRRRDRIRSVLVISEVALACVLLVGAGLLLRSFLHVLDVDLGFEPSRAAAMPADINVSYIGLDKPGIDKQASAQQQESAAMQEMLKRVEAIPGVEAAGITDNLPLGRNRSWGFAPKGKSYTNADYPDALVYIVTPGYLKAMGMILRSGRDFTWDDRADTQKVMIISETTARTFWPGESPIGRIVKIGSSEKQIIGVIADVHETSVEEQPSPEAYMLVSQEQSSGVQLVVRTKLPPAELASSVLSTLRQLNPNQPAAEFRTIQQFVDHATSPRRFFMMLVTVFATLGLILASLGIYGVISYSVTQQTQEIGIRMALGATKERVQLDVLTRTLRMALIGIAAGTIVSLLASQLITSLLFGTKPTDPIIFGGMVLLLSAVAFVAGYIPARRASRINPMIALRSN
jgi:predicted permease